MSKNSKNIQRARKSEIENMFHPYRETHHVTLTFCLYFVPKLLDQTIYIAVWLHQNIPYHTLTYNEVLKVFSDSGENEMMKSIAGRKWYDMSECA